jgi:hypothetical protein
MWHGAGICWVLVSAALASDTICIVSRQDCNNFFHFFDLSGPGRAVFSYVSLLAFVSFQELIHVGPDRDTIFPGFIICFAC